MNIELETIIENSGLSEAKFSFGQFFNVEFTRPKTTQKTTQKKSNKLSENQLNILKYLVKNPHASRKELNENISNIGENGIKYNLKRLQELNIIERIGSDKGGYWHILENKKTNN
jgi:ATP-dependent DNA helicase RecG